MKAVADLLFVCAKVLLAKSRLKKVRWMGVRDLDGFLIRRGIIHEVYHVQDGRIPDHRQWSASM